MKQQLLFALLLVISITAKAGDEKNVVKATLKSVTVYKVGAEMVHQVSATLVEGSNELVIEQLSNQLDINNIQIKTDKALTVMGTEFSSNYLNSTEKTITLKLLEDSLEKVKQSLNKLEVLSTNTTNLLDILKANRDIKGTQTGISVTELMKLMDYQKTKMLELQNELEGIGEKKNKLSAIKTKLNNQIEEEHNNNTNRSGRLTLQLSAVLAGKYNFTITYITQNAFWNPAYDVRVEDTKNPLKLIYKAKIVQTTGIDWKQVKLSLATSTPSQYSTAPNMDTWFLSYLQPRLMSSLALAKPNLVEKDNLNDLVVVGYAPKKSKKEDDESQPLYILNGNIVSASEGKSIKKQDYKSFKILKEDEAVSKYGEAAANGAIEITTKSSLEDYVSTTDNTLNATFDIDIPYDIPTNGKEQLATLKTYTLPAIYREYSVPKIDQETFLLADVPGIQALNLLPGDANIIVENTNVGKTFIDPNSVQDTFNLTLGVDKRVTIQRQKISDYSRVRFLGSNKLQQFTFEITVKNNKKEAVTLSLKDQFPISTTKEIEVELTDAGGATVNNDLGSLDWKLPLSAGEQKKIRFSYSVKYPKDKTLNL